MSSTLSQIVAASALVFAASITSAATIEVTLVDLQGKLLKSEIAGAVNEVRIVAISNGTQVTVTGSQITSFIPGTTVLGSEKGESGVLTIQFTPPTDPVAFVVLARRFDQGRVTAAVPFVVSTGNSLEQKLTIAVPRAESYRMKQPCPSTHRPRCFFRRCR